MGAGRTIAPEYATSSSSRMSIPRFVTGIRKDSVRRWNLWFPSAGVFAEVLAGRTTGTQITFPLIHH